MAHDALMTAHDIEFILAINIRGGVAAGWLSHVIFCVVTLQPYNGNILILLIVHTYIVQPLLWVSFIINPHIES